jgi:regulator-associated protein of mTOR
MVHDEIKRSEHAPFVIKHGKFSTRNKEYKIYFNEERHSTSFHPSQRTKVAKWRVRGKSTTTSGTLIMCLNLGVDPPDIIKPHPCARLETWLDPTSVKQKKVLKMLGERLQAQYKQLQSKISFELCLDPTVDAVKEQCVATRKDARANRALFHYNGHGVPKPTTNGELWVFDDEMKQSHHFRV